ncbi:hypothetical protein TCAL_09568 [Tigriopus californicus]|uniref:CUB domain-containing protein n=1 Tax=Tigriopus californicus TaxID=6832 RepID=A0A553PTD7_TIGCA|nr:uncharacterized protein LOC131891669 [Tigriopus californicus]TRY80950.1 hypothetical protein TCAL_09568 [Tigriopus californicus]
MWSHYGFVLVVVVLANFGVPFYAGGANVTQSDRDGKLLSLFNVVRFQNSECEATSSRKGICYTEAECSSRQGSASGSCANGFGVCCLFSLNCGGTSSESCAYLVQSGSNIPSPCTYTICKSHPSICRIKFDFMAFTINGPIEGTVVSLGAVVSSNAGAIGDCTRDTFSITAPENFSPPVICGYNTGQHMIVDASDACHTANFVMSGTGTRSWDIKVTQYKCGDEMGGDSGCLQWFTGETGTFASFNFPTTTAALPPTTTHLSNQLYSMCWRQEVGTCGICWEVVNTGQDTESFGLSTGRLKLPHGDTDGRCIDDYLLIPDAVTDAANSAMDTFTIGSTATDIHLSDRVCGRFFSSAKSINDRKASLPICSQRRPFRMTFVTDGDEIVMPVSNPIKAGEAETTRFPGGIVGFHLKWTLQPC